MSDHKDDSPMKTNESPMKDNEEGRKRNNSTAKPRISDTRIPRGLIR